MAAEYRTVAAADDWRLPGCSDFCRKQRVVLIGSFGVTDLVLHSPDSHEQYGLAVGLANGAERLPEITTGPLRIDQADQRLYVNGETANLSPTEWRIFSVLARQIGRLVETQAIVHAVWGSSWIVEGRLPEHQNAHLVRVNMARIRAKLGPARSIISTRRGMGYTLLAVPYTGPTP